MKRFLVGLLLVIFSVQSAIAAIGDRAVWPGHEGTHGVWASVALEDFRSFEGEEPDVFPAVEELSDYVIIGLTAPKARHMTVVVSSLPDHLLSTDLPKVKPPPRS